MPRSASTLQIYRGISLLLIQPMGPASMRTACLRQLLSHFKDKNRLPPKLPFPVILAGGSPKGKETLRNFEAVFPAVVLKLDVKPVLADQIEVAPVDSFTGFYQFDLQFTDTGLQLLHFPGVAEVNDQMDGFLFHRSQASIRADR